jgi:DNA-binding NarL/FixJ family response regulator
MTRSVLVVDDDAGFRELAGRLLSASGLVVVGEAGGVAAALAAAVRLEPVGVLVDVELPDGDGVALTRELVALAWGPRVLLTSIDGDVTTVGEARRAGARGFVVKTELPHARLGWLLTGDDPGSRGRVG